MPTPDFLNLFLKSPEGGKIMSNALAWFSTGKFPKSSPKFTDWSAVVSDAKAAWGARGKALATDVGVALKAWADPEANPRDPQLINAVVSKIDAMTSALMGIVPTQADAATRFNDAHFTAMATMARMRDDAETKTVESIAVGLSNIRLATVCDSYIEMFGVPPEDARIGKDEKASEYWESWMQVVGNPLHPEQKILDSLRLIEQISSPFDQRRLDAVDELVSQMEQMTIRDSDSAFERAGILLAESMRSSDILPGGAYRADQPDTRPTARSGARTLGDPLVVELDAEVTAVRTERARRDRLDDKHPETGRVR